MSPLFLDLLSALFALLFLFAALCVGAIGLLRFLTSTDSGEKWLWDEDREDV